MSQKYRTIPVEVYAEKYKQGMEDGQTSWHEPYIKEKFGSKVISKGDWIITDQDVNKSVCKSDDFEKTYEVIV